MNDQPSPVGEALARLRGPVGDALRAAQAAAGDHPPPPRRPDHSLSPADLAALRAAQGDARATARRARWEAGMGGWREFRGATLADFPGRWADPAREWLAGSTQMLTLRGSVGSGKTRLAVALGQAALADGKTVAGSAAADLLDALHPGGDGDLVARWDAELLILDDVGSGSVKEFGLGRLLQLVDQRRRSGARIIRTTNLSPEQETADAERIWSRLAGEELILKGPDRRRAAR